jgi:CCR4-NOT transcription complex subunit 9
MLQPQHVFSHQHQFPQQETNWNVGYGGQGHHQQPQQHHQPHQGHLGHTSQAQSAAAAAAQAQQHHFNRMQMNAGIPNSASSMVTLGDNGQITGMNGSGVNEESQRVLNWISELMSGSSREAALLELSKKRESLPELALILWSSFGVMTSLLQEIISVYPLLNPSQLTAAASNRVCNALALLQCVASHNDTRQLFLSGISSLNDPVQSNY